MQKTLTLQQMLFTLSTVATSQFNILASPKGTPNQESKAQFLSCFMTRRAVYLSF